MVVKINLIPAINCEGLLVKAILENVVEDPQATAAPNANNAATTVPLPVSRLTNPSLKVTKYAAANANTAQYKYLFLIGSFKKIIAVVTAKMGCNFCNRNTTENGIKLTFSKAVVNQSVPKTPLKSEIKINSQISFRENLILIRSLNINGIKIAAPIKCS